MTDNTPHDEGQEPTRRDFIHIAAVGTLAVGGGLVGWMLIDQMNPAADTKALAQKRVNISAIMPGQQITVMWRGGPVFVARLTDETVAAESAVEMRVLPDGVARNENIDEGEPATAENRIQQGNLVVMKGNCTHLGCVPLGDAGDYDGGWFCPCHGSHYDAVGRIRRGPAPENLPIPPVVFEGDAEIVIG